MRYQKHHFRTINRDGYIGGAASIQPKSINEDERSVRWVLTEETPDRAVIVDGDTPEAGDIVRVNGVRWNGDRLPLLQFHDYSRHSVGVMTDLGVEGNQFRGTARFNPAGVNPDADIFWGQIAAGHHDTGSIGFVPIAMSEIKAVGEDGEAGDFTGAIDFEKSYLIEYSMVPVPMLQTSTALGFDPDEYDVREVCTDIIGYNPHITTREQIEETVSAFTEMLQRAWFETCSVELPSEQADGPDTNLGEPAQAEPARKTAAEIGKAIASRIKAQVGL